MNSNIKDIPCLWYRTQSDLKHPKVTSLIFFVFRLAVAPTTLQVDVTELFSTAQLHPALSTLDNNTVLVPNFNIEYSSSINRMQA